MPVKQQRSYYKIAKQSLNPKQYLCKHPLFHSNLCHLIRDVSAVTDTCRAELDRFMEITRIVCENIQSIGLILGKSDRQHKNKPPSKDEGGLFRARGVRPFLYRMLGGVRYYRTSNSSKSFCASSLTLSGIVATVQSCVSTSSVTPWLLNCWR